MNASRAFGVVLSVILCGAAFAEVDFIRRQSVPVPKGENLAVADLDGDTDIFLACGVWNEGVPNRVYLNRGDGTFTDSGQRLGNVNSFGVSLADLDHDGDIDAFVANGASSGGNPNKAWLNDGSGHFTEAAQQLGTVESREALLADLDGDGDPDAFVTHLHGDNPALCPNRIWLNQGDGTFQDSGQRLGQLPTAGLALGDLDVDGDLDAFVINSIYQKTRPDKVWLNDGRGHFQDADLDLGNEESKDVVLADLDGDTDLDAVVVYPHALGVLINVEVRDESLTVRNTTSGETHLTVQRAISQAQPGDIIEIGPGLHEESLRVDKDIVLRSVDPNAPHSVGGTIVQGNPDEPVVTLPDMSSSCQVTGLTIRAGRIGIAGSGTNATIRNCRIMDNVTHGLELSDGSRPHLLNCLITDNGETGITMLTGTGRWARPCTPIVENCIIVDNGEGSLDGGQPIIADSIID